MPSIFIPPATAEAQGLLPTGGAYGSTVLPREVTIPGDGTTGPFSLGLVPVGGSLSVFLGPLRMEAGTHFSRVGAQLWTSDPVPVGTNLSATFFA